LRQAAEKGLEAPKSNDAPVSLLTQPEEIALLQDMAGYPELLQNAALDLAPHRVIFYLQDLAGKFHSYYNKHRVIDEEHPDITKARLLLVQGIKIVLQNGLNLLGVNAPDSM
jgi:arginyl-tRNA synthetase